MPTRAHFDSYILCATPRSGSTLLCNLLAGTGVAGDPDSFFMAEVDPVWAGRWGLPAREGLSEEAHAAAYLTAAVAAGRGRTGMFGLRLMRETLGDLSAMIDKVHPGLPSDRDRLQAAFGRVLYIHLARGDKLAQAVSMVKAEQSGLWHVGPDGAELERLSSPREPEYDFGRIAAKLAGLEAQDTAWLAWFAQQGIIPLTVRYEDLSADPARSVAQICDALGVQTPSPGSLTPGVAKLADAVSLDWMARFRAEAR
ncbi:Stf0 family sulfotransferase [Frigidibacter sp.]|uniref:Stf0 family sulfotransferase n=1 Tax=Frigidibacter sp. TaxID=2586418 RepID=UPI002736B5BE|nr:Stf0 family sulfotransferase [Frigidibacter sp.]MDP3340041.1 Stf0 family sulfotransferase [Frigidibacter sp.]